MSTAMKERLHRLVDALPESEHDTAARVLEALGHSETGGPLYTIATALFDDEPETGEERAAVAEARAASARGERIPAEEIYREFGV